MFHTSLPTKTLQDNNTKTEDKASSIQSVPPNMMFQPTRFSRFQVLPPVLCTRRLYIHVIVLLVVGFLVLLLRTMASMRLAFVHYHLESDTDGELVILPAEFTQSKGAFCLDGSPPAYYYRQSDVPAVRFWIIHLQSGGWCTTKEECYDRSFSSLGSSLKAHISQPLRGIMSSDCNVNPSFCMWHFVDLLYCDGGSFLGNRTEPLLINSKQLYLRGAIVFDSLIEYLRTYTLFRDAEQIILTGSSAGGLGALIHADRLRQRLPETVITLHLVVDGSLFLDVLDISGVPTMANLLHNMYFLHHAFNSAGIKECTRLMNQEEEWRCILPELYYKFVFSPIFFINSLYDTWFRDNALGISCSAQECPSTHLPQVESFKSRLLQEGAEILKLKKNGLFFTPCPAHTFLMSRRFSLITAIQHSVQQALSAWINHQGNSRNLAEVVPLQEALKKCPDMNV